MILCSERPFEHLSACILELGHDERCHFARGKSAEARTVDIYEQTPRGQSFTFVRMVKLPEEAQMSREGIAQIWASVQADNPGQTALDVG